MKRQKWHGITIPTKKYKPLLTKELALKAEGVFGIVPSESSHHPTGCGRTELVWLAALKVIFPEQSKKHR